jgi:hypothetical protein
MLNVPPFDTVVLVTNATVRERLASKQTARTRTRAREEQETDQKARYLRAVEQVGTLRAGCKAARVSHNTVYAWRELDEVFAMAENQARSTFADGLEEEVVRRARDGYDRPVYQGGELVGYERVYSDNLLWKLLQAVRPEKYRDKLDLNVASVVKEVVGFDPKDVL